MDPATKRKHAILQAARAVFAQEGYRQADVQVIANQAGVGKGTVYRHFGNKEKLFLATARFCLEQLGLFVGKSLAGDPEATGMCDLVGYPEVLRRIAIGCAQYYQQHPECVEIMIQERAEFRESIFPSMITYRDENRHSVESYIEKAIAKGQMRPVDVVAASNAYSDLIYGCVINGCLAGAPMQLVDRVAQAMEIFLLGLTHTRSGQLVADGLAQTGKKS